MCGMRSGAVRGVCSVRSGAVRACVWCEEWGCEGREEWGCEHY